MMTEWMNKWLMAIFCWMIFMPVPDLLAQSAKTKDDPRITLRMKEVSLPEVLSEIERQAGVTFSYESSLLKELPKISFQVKDEALTDCLTRLFESYPIVYKVSGKIVILKRRQRQVTISGFVRDQASSESLIGASVYEVASRKGSATNSYGFFSLTLPPGNIRLHASYIGYESCSFNFTELDRDTILNIELRPNARLEEVVVTASERDRLSVNNTLMGTMEFSQKTIKATPTLFGESDIVKTLQLTPGVASGTEGLAGLYVRGGDQDGNLFLIDGNPVYQINHVGGLFSAFNPEAIRNLDFFKAGFPARYGGRLSSVVDVHTKEGNMKEYHGSAMLGLTSGNLNFEGPIIKNRTSFNASFRRSWLDGLSAPGVAIYNKIQKKNGEKFSARYAFTDLNLKVNHHINDRSQAYVNFYFGQDFLKGGSSEFSVGDDITPFENKDFGKMRWGNIALSSGWSHVFNNKMFGTVTLAYSHYQSKLKQETSQYYGTEGDKDYSSRFIETSTRNGINDFGVHANFDYIPTPAHHIRYGTDYLYHRFSPEYIEEKTSENLSPTKRTTGDERLSANELAVFAEDDWAISSIVRVNAGLRLNMYNIQKKTYVSLDPRLSVRFLLTRNLSLKTSYARMNQYVHQISESYMSLPTDMWMPVSKKLKPLESDQVSVGAYYNLHKDYSFSVEGYHKWMNHLLDYKDGYNFLPSFVGWEEKLAAGKGWAYGAEFIARKETGRITGWIGYGLMWSDRQFDEINNGKRFPAKYDNRHKLNIVANWKINEKLELTGSWTFMTGNRVTVAFENYEDLGLTPVPPLLPEGGLDYFTERNNVRLPAYHRLDLGINIYRPKKNGHLGIWNISVYNAYCQMNPITIHKRSWINYSHYFETLSLLPIIPSISYTYKF